MKQTLRYTESNNEVRINDTIAFEEGTARVREILEDFRVLVEFEDRTVRPNWRTFNAEEIGAKVLVENTEIKPPQGLRPRYIWVSERIIEINEAIKRYETAKKPIPRAWLIEKEALLGSVFAPLAVSDSSEKSMSHHSAYSIEDLDRMREFYLMRLLNFGPLDAEVQGQALLNRAQEDEVLATVPNNIQLAELLAFLLNNAKHLLKEK